MNILPNSFLTSPILNAAAASSSSSAATSSPSALLKQQQNATASVLQSSSAVSSPAASSASITATVKSSSGDRFRCVVCEEPLEPQAVDPPTYQMLAVRPSIGTPAGPFFPILETLTSTSAVRVPCCTICSASLLDQWTEYEAKNVSIKNRVYNLQAKYIRFQPSKPPVLPPGASSLFLLQQHPSLVNNGTASPAGSAAATVDSNSRPSSSSRDSSPQDEVLDLSMPSGATPASSSKPSTPATPSSLSPQNLSRTNSGSSQSGLKVVANVLPFGSSVAATTSGSGARSQPTQPPSQSQLAQTRNVSLELAAAAVQSLPQFFNSSMTNLIKVTSNPAPLTPLKRPSEPAFAPPVLEDPFSYAALSSAPAPTPAKKPLFICSLCDDPCTQLVPLLLRPVPNVPHFPTLTTYVKSPQIDSNGRINVCESCHRQLLHQFDVHQKHNKPVMERFYQLTKSTVPQSVLSFPPRHPDLHSSSATALLNSSGSASALANVTALLRNNHLHIPSISAGGQSIQQVSFVSKSLFSCIACGKDLLFAAASNLTGSVESEPSSSSVVYSILTEAGVDRGPETPNKLILSSALEFSLKPFMPNANSVQGPNIQPQLSFLLDTGRVLCCVPCFDVIISRSSKAAAPSSSSVSNSTIAIAESVHKTVAGRSHRDPVNGHHVVKSSSHESSEVAASELCLACNTNKAQLLVETRENSTKEPFFPFLRDACEPHGRARLCGACHLILETQWDAHEAGYVPYSQRTYGLPRPGSNGPVSVSSSGQTNLLLSGKRPPSHSHGGSSSPVVLSNFNQTSVVHSNGQPTPPPLKIQISSPSIAVPASVTSSLANSAENCQLLLTTVNNSSSSNSTNVIVSSVASAHYDSPSTPNSIDRLERPASGNVDNELIFQTINEFIAKLGGPHGHVSGNCVICGEHNKPGEGYQIYSVPQKVLVSPELGQLPFFPMLKNFVGNAATKKLKVDTAHVTCLYCYHSLIAQWAAYHVSNFPEDRDPVKRVYNCRDFICFVCGVTTYRSLVRSITVKDFPFLIEHKRPLGSLSFNKGESVITCQNCFDTLTHQWIENERMKVPLEMRQYNWMPVPQPPPPTSNASSGSEVQPTHSDHSARTTSMATLPTGHLAILNHNGLSSGTALTLVSNAQSSSSNSAATSIPYQTIISGTASSDTTTTVRPSSAAPIVTFNPSHTLAPLVAAAMAATPVATNKESTSSGDGFNSATTMSGNSASFAEALRTLARRHMNSTFPAVLKSEPQQTAPTLTSNHVNHTGGMGNQHQPPQPATAASLNHCMAINNLSTLASVAAMAGSSQHLSHNAADTATTATTATSTAPNHAIVLNLADGKPHLLPSAHHGGGGYPGDPKFILATTAIPEQLMENGRTNGRFLLNPGANGGNLIIQFNSRPNNRESPASSSAAMDREGGQSVQYQHLHHSNHHGQHHAHGHALAVHKSAHGPVIGSGSHGPRDHHQQQPIQHGSSKSQTSATSNRMQTPTNRSADSLEGHSVISLYDKNLSKVSLEEAKLRNKRLARQQQQQEQQQSYMRTKRVRLSSVENNSELSGDEELEIVEEGGEEDEDEDVDWEEGEPAEEIGAGGQSLLTFVESILPPLPPSNDPAKLSFLAAFGLTTKKVLQEAELRRFVSRQVKHRVSQVSFKLAVVQDEDVLAKDVDDLGRIESSDLLPTEDRLAERPEEKAQLMGALDLIPVAKNEDFVLKRELSWLAVIRERQIRRKRGYPFTRPLLNNVSGSVLSKWLPTLAGNVDLDDTVRSLEEGPLVHSQELRLSNLIQPLIDLNYEEIRLKPKKLRLAPEASNSTGSSSAGQSRRDQQQQHNTPTISRSSKHRPEQHSADRASRSSRSTPNHDNQHPANSGQNHNSSQLQQQQQPVLHHLPTSKLINSKQFAQEFHESVLQETKMKMNKQLSVNHSDPAAVTGGSSNGHHHPAAGPQLNAQAYHTIIYGDPLRPNHDGALNNNHHHNHSDRPAPNSAPPVPSQGSMFKFPEKIGPMQEQMRKLQQRLAQISQETQYLTEKRNEIEASLHKLDEERSSCQVELERLATCLENSIV